MPQNSHLEIAVLKIIASSSSPVGAGIISECLSSEHSLNVSEAGVGRILRNFRMKGFLEKVSFQGHLITETGKARLDELENAKQMSELMNELVTSSPLLEDYSIMDILIARKAIECEAAAQAARNATADDLRKLQKIVDKQYDEMKKGKDYTFLSKEFHSELIKASHVPILSTLYNLIGLSVQWQGVFVGSFKTFRQPLNVSHEEILELLKNREPEKAGAAMSRHIDVVIENAKKLYSRDSGSSDSKSHQS